MSNPIDDNKSYLLKPFVHFVRNRSIKACEQRAEDIYASRYSPDKRGLNLGSGNTGRWKGLSEVDFCHNRNLDFNTIPLPFETHNFNIVVCEQVIEHLHNTTYFLSEINRVLRVGGDLILATENLASLPNIFALILQHAPFSTQSVCHSFIGGWRDEGCGFNGWDNPCSINHPAYSGVTGHVRVMTVNQIKILLNKAGFYLLSKHGFGGNHYVLFHAIKINSPKF